MRHTLLSEEEAARIMRRGGVVAYPTEAVFGLGCDPRNEAAVRRVRSLRHRPEDVGLILIASEFEQFADWLAPADPAPARATWPGPVTWLFPCAETVPRWVSGGRARLAIRVTAHPVCRKLCDRFGGPIVSTGASPESAPPARSAGTVENYFGTFIDGIVAGPLGGRERCSEIRDLASGEIVRPA